MTNPNNTIGTNGAYGGRTSVEALNDCLAVYAGRGIVNGFAVSPSSGLTLTIGGATGIRDVAIAQDNEGNKTTVNNRLADPCTVTIATANSSLYRGDAVVAYVNNPPSVSATTIDNPTACGLIAVSGSTASTASAVPYPTEQQIRSAITADGAVGSSAFYVVLAKVLVNPGATTITAGNITQGDKVTVSPTHVPIATSATVGGIKLTLSPTDIGEGAPLAEGTLYGVYE